MKKHIYDEKTGISYTLQGDYYLPDIALPNEEQQPVGLWGQRHLRYIKQHRKVLYTNLLTSGKLNSYLVDIDKQAEEMFSRLVKQMAEREDVTEALKAENQMEWVGRMNNIRSRATEIVNNDLIYTF
ncbi:MAG: TnpV protein [Clostridia bacterium]|nr:TnpV protein [Clostridia bacterium]